MKSIIATVGLIGSGKDYRAQEYIKQGYKHINFADPMKRIVEEIFGFEKNMFKHTPYFYEAFKKSEIKMFGEMSLVGAAIQSNLNGRQFLQRLGTDVGRNMFGEDFWVNQWKKSIGLNDNVVVTDCRFENEIDALLNLEEYKKTTIKFIHCAYQSEKYKQTIANGDSGHESEKLAWELHNLGFKDGEDITEYMKKTYG